MTIAQNRRGQKVAVIGAGISGLSAAWLLSKSQDITLFEAGNRFGGHSHTVDVPTASGTTPVDTGFIVYNTSNYPNLTAMFDHLGVPTKDSNMGFAVSLDNGRMEYGGDNLVTLFSQLRNILSPRFWSMLRDLLRFYREAPGESTLLGEDMTSLGDFLDARGYGEAFQNDHILPQAAAIWSASASDIRAFPAAAFIRFCANHGLLKVTDRPVWRTVDGGSRVYVAKLIQALGSRCRAGTTIRSVSRTPSGVLLRDGDGGEHQFDQVVIATHADQGLALLAEPTEAQRSLIGAFAYTQNVTVLHSDIRLMPRRRGLWSAWNYLGRATDNGDRELCVTYWMNRLQGLPTAAPLLVTLNPVMPPDPRKMIMSQVYEHPLFDAGAMRAQRRLWSIQGEGAVWWCGAYFGSGFHEDGLQAGLAVAEAIGGVRRPWTVHDESGRIFLCGPRMDLATLGEAA